MHQYEVSYISQRKVIITGCIICLILPVLICLCHTFIEKSSGFEKWINLHYFSNNESWAVITLCLLDIGSAINEYTFPLVTTILLSFIYLSYCRVSLKPLTDQLKETREHPTKQNIAKCLEMTIKVWRLWLEIEDFTSIIAFFLCGLSFTKALHLIAKYVFKGNSFTTMSVLRIATIIFFKCLC